MRILFGARILYQCPRRNDEISFAAVSGVTQNLEQGISTAKRTACLVVIPGPRQA